MSIGLFGFCDVSEKPQNLAAKTAAGCRGASLKVRDDSIEAREHTHFKPKIKRLFGARRRFELSPARAGGGYLVAVPLGVNRSFFRTPGRSPDASGSSNQDPAIESVKSELSTSSAARLPTSRTVSDFGSFFKDLRPISGFVVGPVPSGGGYLVAGPRAVNRPFAGLPPIPGKLRIFWRRPVSAALGSRGFPRPKRRRSTSRTVTASSG